MPVSVYFNNYQASNEQTLLEDLIIESISIYGQDCFYLPRTLDNKDEIYEQSDLVSYNSAYMVPMYLENVEGFAGDGDFLSKFGIEIRNQVIFSVAQRVFEQDVINEESTLTLTRPREGDLIWFPLNAKLFQIKYVDKFQMYYQLGALQTWKMTCELFEYSGEKFNTGIPELDRLTAEFTPDLLQWALWDEANNYLVNESNNVIVTEKYKPEIMDTLDDSNAIQIEANSFIDFSVSDPFSEGNY